MEQARKPVPFFYFTVTLITYFVFPTLTVSFDLPFFLAVIFPFLLIEIDLPFALNVALSVVFNTFNLTFSPFLSVSL